MPPIAVSTAIRSFTPFSLQFSKKPRIIYLIMNGSKIVLCDHARTIFKQALKAVAPGDLVRRAVSLEGSVLHVINNQLDLDEPGRLVVVGAGKAAAPMAEVLESILGECLWGGAVIVNDGAGLPLKRIELLEAGHPIPDQRGSDATAKIIHLLHDLSRNDAAIVLITGGGSALLESPAEGISLGDLQQTTSVLLKCGAEIREINALRKHLSRIKGGQLLTTAAPARVLTLAISDVVGDEPSAIASGPTVPDVTTFGDAWEVVSKYSLEGKLPPAVLERLKAGSEGRYPETPKADDPRFQNSRFELIGSNRDLLDAARKAAEKLGYHAIILTGRMQGEAAQTGCNLARLMKAVRRSSERPLCLLAGGETTVTVQGSGIGGRNQELALSAAMELEGVEGCLLLSAGSDGADGPTDAAGAIVDCSTVSRAAQLGLDAGSFLRNNDSYPFFAALGDHVKTGPTLTNVMDLVIMLVE
jgi:glycerate-2-kinase